MSDVSTASADFTADIIIVGSGMVGGTLALALARIGYQVALVDSKSLMPSANDLSAQVELRTTAISCGALSILKALGIDDVEESIRGVIGNIQVSQQGMPGTVRITAAEHSLPALGYVLSNTVYVQSLLSAFKREPRIALFDNAVVEAIDNQHNLCTLQVSRQGKHSTLMAKLLMGVDGSNSTVGNLCGFETSSLSYQQSAILCTLETTGGKPYTAFERFTPNGPMAMLPLKDNNYSLVYVVDATDEAEVMELSDAAFVAHVQRVAGFRNGRFIGCTNRVALPLQLIEAKKQFSGRVMLFGNAARSLHPVAGQGFNLAVRDIGFWVSQLASSQQLAGQDPCDPGDPEVLTRFLSERRVDQSRTIHTTDVLARLFRGQATGLSLLRSVGLLALDSLAPVKAGFTRTAMGIQSGLPDLPYRD